MEFVAYGILVVIIITSDEEASCGRYERNFKWLNSIYIIHFTNGFRAPPHTHLFFILFYFHYAVLQRVDLGLS